MPNTVGRIRRHLVTILTLKVWKVSVWKEYSHFVQKDPQVTCALFFRGHPFGSQEGTRLGTIQSSETGSGGGAQQACGAASSFLLPILGSGLCRQEGRLGRQAQESRALLTRGLLGLGQACGCHIPRGDISLLWPFFKDLEGGQWACASVTQEGAMPNQSQCQQWRGRTVA